MEAKRIVEYKPDPNKFDLVTHRWDGQGRLVGKNPYRTYIIEGRSYFERPVNSGNLWFENNQPAGRVELTFNDKGHIASKKFEFDAAHKEYTAPLTGAERVHYELEQERSKTAALEAELAAIKAEREPKKVINHAPQAAAVAEPQLKKRG